MALSEEDKKEMIELFSAGVSEGLKKFRSEAEEATAKAQAQQENDANKGGNSDADAGKSAGFSLGNWLLGGRITSS